ncbi:putative rsc complex subunit rsc9 [Phaeomoniella chlamydospora]|uniref:Putative rsc complex subunit rsc9 n=1 Tax=Phaeomoniella chlamydospora TaxID=158046 RepID=A0A0G2DYT7_PHACM|nr:putative rsc complex subunit rsc9 [Phaeomoniella chlamydospora]
MAPGPTMMAPNPNDIENERFIDDVAAYHKQRGTGFDREPKVSGRPIHLLNLYKAVLALGGYDAVSAERMQWRELAKSFGLGTHHEAAMAFQLKTVYYKYLAAYEITNHWHEVPPPPEILEHRTAKGGDLRHRTLENYQIGGPRESLNIEEAGRDSGEDETRTPKAEGLDADDSLGRYPSRLRKEVIPFQPDTTPARASRHAANTHSPQQSPVPGPPYGQIPIDYRQQVPSVMNYVPQQPMPLTLRQVITPGNNPDVFRQRVAMAKAQKLPKPQIHPQHLLRGNLPPSQFSGPNIYIRCLYGLRSGVPEEQEFALHHLVKISYERGDKYKFEGFPMLAESLIGKSLEITELLYGVKWEVSYGEQTLKPNILDGSFGTPNLLENISILKTRANSYGVESAEFQHKLQRVTEAIVIIRNMVCLEDNASFLSNFPYFREFLVIALNLPKVADTSEYEHCALKICEEVTPFFAMSVYDPLYQSLLKYIESNDRGAVLSALKAVDYISGDLPYAHKLVGLSANLVDRICQLTTLPDEEVQIRALKILYQYTSHPENLLEAFTTSPPLLEPIVPRLVEFLMTDARQHESKVLKKPAIKAQPNTVIPSIPPELLIQLIRISEPDRSKYWLRSCFEEDLESDITQIAIWQAYQAQFSQHTPLAASEFIKNVSSTFSTAQAQVVNGPQPRFIIKGIRPRRVPVDLSGNRLQKCLWEIPSIDPTQPGTRQCSTYHLNRQGLWNHILNSHLHFQRDEDQKFIFQHGPPGGYKCCWPNCHKAPLSNTRDIGTHVKIHLPDDASLKSTASALSSIRSSALGVPASSKSEDFIQEAEYYTFTYYESPVEANQLVGLPGPSLLVLQNLARNLNKLMAQEKAAASIPGGGLGANKRSFIAIMEKTFPKSIKERLGWVMAHNRTLMHGIAILLGNIEKGEVNYRALRGTGDHRDEDEMDL